MNKNVFILEMHFKTTFDRDPRTAWFSHRSGRVGAIFSSFILAGVVRTAFLNFLVLVRFGPKAFSGPAIWKFSSSTGTEPLGSITNRFWCTDSRLLIKFNTFENHFLPELFPEVEKKSGNIDLGDGSWRQDCPQHKEKSRHNYNSVTNILNRSPS